MTTWRRLFGSTLLAVAAIACSSNDAAPQVSPSSTAPASVTAVPHFAHVVVVVMENHGYGQVVGSANAPYVNYLIRTGVLFTASYALTHPSEPNYLALFSGSTHGLTSDACPLKYSGPDLYSVLRAKAKTFVGYSEGLPAVGSTVCRSGEYVRRHAPWVNFTDVPARANQPFTAFPTDYTKLPAVSFVIPNLHNDMHDGTVATGDAWLKKHLGAYVTWARTHNSMLVLTFDEDERLESNRIPTVFVGSHVRLGARIATRIDHYTLLRTIEDAFATAHLGASANRSPITTAWR
jgi:acid phosphatase